MNSKLIFHLFINFLGKAVLIYVAEMIPKLKSRTQNKGSNEQSQNVQAAKKGNKKKRR